MGQKNKRLNSALIEAVFKELHGSDKSFGARSWFARLVDVNPSTITRMCDGTIPADDATLAALKEQRKIAERGITAEAIDRRSALKLAAHI